MLSGLEAMVRNIRGQSGGCIKRTMLLYIFGARDQFDTYIHFHLLQFTAV